MKRHFTCGFDASISTQRTQPRTKAVSPHAASQRLLVVLSTLVLVLFGFAPIGPRTWLSVAASVLFCASMFRRDHATSMWCLVIAAIVVLRTFVPALEGWPAHLLVPLMVAALFSVCARGPRSSDSWARAGSFVGGVRVLTVFVVVLSAGVFLTWAFVADPKGVVPSRLAGASTVHLIAAGLLFASVNACMEELVFRGIGQPALSAAFEKAWPAIVLQAVAFGALHFAAPSVPDGLTGACLTFAYGLALGTLAHLAEGLLACCIAHFVADVLVFMVMVSW